MVAISDLVLVWLGTVGLVASIGMFVQMDDRATNMLIPFIAAIVWGLFMMAGFDVAYTESGETATMWPVVALGGGFAMSSLAFGIYELLYGTAKEVDENMDSIFEVSE